MILPSDATFQPDDGTPVGQALGDLNALLAAVPQTPGAAFVRVTTYLCGAPATVDLLDANDAPLAAPPDLVALDGTPSPQLLAELIAAGLIAEGEPSADGAAPYTSKPRNQSGRWHHSPKSMRSGESASTSASWCRASHGHSGLDRGWAVSLER